MHRSKESAAFAELLAETFLTASERAAHEREVAKLVAFAELLIALDEIRAGNQISKAELARRIGVKPSVVSRLLDGKGRNVQLAARAPSAQAQTGPPRPD
jgi:predicted transcriptional regulator